MEYQTENDLFKNKQNKSSIKISSRVLRRLALIGLFFLLSGKYLFSSPTDRISPTKKNGISIPLVFGGGTSNSKTIPVNAGDVEISAAGGLLFGTGLFYSLPNNLKFGSTFQYQSSEIKQFDQQGSTSFKRYIIAPELKIPIKIDRDSFINIGGGYSFYLNATLDLNDAGPDRISGTANYDNENGVHFLTEYEENFSTGAISVGLKYYKVNYSVKSGDLRLGNLNGMGLDLYVTYSFKF